ncbi:MAG TPA: DUF4097 family beta strand repeat-containing protein [Sphingobacteriaceae bacterium]|nr:DUF4097 family beta strand repeat-containing protein [Sphingobacteriaceae bacterium]
MKTKWILMALLIGCATLTFAQTKELQEHRFKKTSGTLRIEMGLVNVEGYKGDEVIVSRMVETRAKDPRAEGLVGLSSNGLGRNVEEVGIFIQEEGDVTKIRLSKMGKSDTVFVKVPEHLHVVIQEAVLFYSSHNISVKGMAGELEVASTSGNINLQNITGPVTARTAVGNIEAVFNTPVKGPVSLIATTGFIDVALPKSTKAMLDLNSMMGELFVAPELNIDVLTEDISSKESGEKTTTGAATVGTDGTEVVTLSGRTVVRTASASMFDRFGNMMVGFPGINSKVKAKLNGGGEDIILRSTQGKIYLRQTGN